MSPSEPSAGDDRLAESRRGIAESPGPGGTPALPVSPRLLFRGRLDEEDVMAVHRYRWRLAVSRPAAWGLRVTLAALAAFAAWLAWDLGMPVGALGVAAVGVAAQAVPHLLSWWVRHQYRLRMEDYPETLLVLTGERILLETAWYYAEWRWPFLSQVLDTPDGLLILNRSRGVLWLSRREFEGNDYREQILDMARSNRVPVRAVR